MSEKYYPLTTDTIWVDGYGNEWYLMTSSLYFGDLIFEGKCIGLPEEVVINPLGLIRQFYVTGQAVSIYKGVVSPYLESKMNLLYERRNSTTEV